MTKRTVGNNDDIDATVVSTSNANTSVSLPKDKDVSASPSAAAVPPDNDNTVVSKPKQNSSHVNDVEDNERTVIATVQPLKPLADVQGDDATVVATAAVTTVSQGSTVGSPLSAATPLPDNDRTVVASPQQDNHQSQINSAATADYTGSSTGNYTETKNPLTNTFHKPFVLGGEAIKDRFIIKKVLGQGGMGMVCQALDLRRVEADDEEPYIAIKLLSDGFRQHASAFKSLQRETKKTQALAHPNIITVYDFDRDGDTIFMTMEELDGYPLDAIIKGSTDVELNAKTALKIVREIALALEYAHSKGIIHSDLKPGNIFYTKTGQTKVLDFGIARALNSELYKDNFDAGDLHSLTPRYASLEMFEYGDPDPRDDIYALGIIAGQLLAGEHPYRGKTATEVRDGELKPVFKKPLGRLYKKAISKAVAVHRDERTQSASQFLSSLNWAEKGARRVMTAAVVVILLAIANAFLIDSVDTAVPLSDLPAAEQKFVLHNIAEADIALKFQDYNGALVYLEQAYQLHPSNEDVEDRSRQIITVMQEQLDTKKDDADYQKFMLKQIAEVGEYDFIARNEQYQKLQQQLQ